MVVFVEDGVQDCFAVVGDWCEEKVWMGMREEGEDGFDFGLVAYFVELLEYVLVLDPVVKLLMEFPIFEPIQQHQHLNLGPEPLLG